MGKGGVASELENGPIEGVVGKALFRFWVRRDILGPILFKVLSS